MFHNLAALLDDLPRCGRPVALADVLLQAQPRAGLFRAMQDDVQPTLDIDAGEVLLIRCRESAEEGRLRRHGCDRPFRSQAQMARDAIRAPTERGLGEGICRHRSR